MELERRKYYFDGGQIEIAAHLVYELDPEGRQLRVVRFTDYAGEKVRTLFPFAPDLHSAWVDADKRKEIIDRLAERGIDFDQLAAAADQPDADPFDLLCHLAYNAPLRTRRERAERVRANPKDFFERYGPEADVSFVQARSIEHLAVIKGKLVSGRLICLEYNGIPVPQ